jgi:hypothetical protein
LVRFEEVRTPSALRVNCEVMAGLLKVGAFKTIVQRHRIKRNPQTVIPFEEIQRFKSEYVFLFEAARSRKKHARHAP